MKNKIQNAKKLILNFNKSYQLKLLIKIQIRTQFEKIQELESNN